MGIPYLHPVVVHFPIALLVVGALAAVVWLATGRAFWRHVTLGLVLIGAVGAFAARQTGEEIEEGLEAVKPQSVLLETHEESADQATIAAFLALGALAVAERIARRERRSAASHDTPPSAVRTHRVDALPVRLVGALLVVTAAGLVGRTGHLGGQMTWGTTDAPATRAAVSAPGEAALPAPAAPAREEAEDDQR